MTDPIPALALGPALRALRRDADLSQRQLAERSGVPAGTIARIEAGTAADPRFRTVERLVRAMGRFLTIADSLPAIPHEEVRDRAARHSPAHLDARPQSGSGGWTYDLDRRRRDRRRAGIAAAERVEIVRIGDWYWVGRAAGGSRIAWLRAAPWDGELVHVVAHVDFAWRGYGIGHRLVEALRTEMNRTGVRRARALAESGVAATFFQRCGFTSDWRRPIRLTLDLGNAAQEPPR